MSWKTFKWNMVNVTASYSPKHFFWKLYVIIRPWPSWQQILHFSQVLESIHKFKKKFHTLQCLFLGALISNKWGVGSFQIYQKDRLFHPLWQPSTLGGNPTMLPPSCTFQKWPSPSLYFGQEENIPGHSTEKKAY